MPMLIIPSCRDTSRLVSESMDRRLPFFKRLLVRVHLLKCKYCRRFEQQLRHIRTLSRHLGENPEPLDDPSIALTDEARERIRESVRTHSAGI